MFSGGLDSAVIAAIAHYCLPPGEAIYLINVAFEQPSTNSPSGKGSAKLFDVPDRQTGITALEELENIFSDRKFNFVAVNVTKDELIERRNEHIKNLLYPLDTVLDDNIGCALWLAARGAGVLSNLFLLIFVSFLAPIPAASSPLVPVVFVLPPSILHWQSLHVVP